MSHEKNVCICRCEEVTEGEILRAIEEGARTVKGIKIRTQATMGLCQGRTCWRLIVNILSKHVDINDISKLEIGIRVPVRTIKIKNFIYDEGKGYE